MRFATLALCRRLAIAFVTLFAAWLAHIVVEGQWSAMIYGAAGIILALSLAPGLLWLVKPVVTHLGLWLVFNLVRATADDTAWADRVMSLVPRFETKLAGGRLPSAVLQGEFYDPRAVDAFDYGWTVVYLSFFIIPHLAALMLLWRDRRTFWHYVLATGILFLLALIGFFITPTAPPWMVTEAVPEAGFPEVRRVTEEVLLHMDIPVRLFDHPEDGSGRTGEVRLEPNSIAAMPSIHFAVTVLLAYVARKTSVILYGPALVYTCLMGIALVYLGEHYVLDLAAGELLAGTGWAIAGRWLASRVDA